jgi:hypothetical protein
MYDMLGENARAALGKVKQLKDQGTPPDQVEAQMMDAARNGLLPIGVAFAAQRMLERSQTPAARPPQQGTVVSDMIGQLAQRQQGVAGLPNPVMGNSTFTAANGGIVAFAGGDMVGDPHEDDYLPRSSRTASTATAEAEELAALEAKAAQGAATKPELSRLAKLKAFFTQPVTGQGARNVAAGAIEGGLGALGTVAKSQAYIAPVAGLAAARYQQNDVPAEYLENYYKNEGNSAPYWNAIDTPDKGDKKFTMGEGTSGLGEAWNRVHAGIGKAVDIASFGLADTDPYSQYYKELEARQQAAAAQAEAPAGGEDLSRLVDAQRNERMGRYNAMLDGALGDSGVASLDRGYADLKRQVGETDERKVKPLESFVDEQAAIDTKYGIDKPLTARQAKIEERRRKVEEEGKKSILTDLGMAFLTKGVMAAGEGKDTLSAMAYAVEDGAKTHEERKDRLEAIKDKLDEREDAVQSQLASLHQNQITRGVAKYESELGNIRDNKKTAISLQSDYIRQRAQQLDAAAGRRVQIALAKVNIMATFDEKNKLTELTQLYTDLSLRGDPRAARVGKILDDVVAKVTPAVVAANAKAKGEVDKLNMLTGAGGADNKEEDDGYSATAI